MPDRRPWWASDPVQITTAGTGRQALFSGNPAGASAASYRRARPSNADEDGFVWVEPSATQWPNVKGNPPGPRTQKIGYNLEERAVRCVFRDGTKWVYNDVPPDVWERVRRTASTGRFISRVLDKYPYGPDDW